MKELVYPIIRHGLTSVGGYLAAKGIIASSAVDQVTGAFIVLAGVVWSLVEKQLAKKSQGADTTQTPPTTPSV
jgi:FAD/FMN-containing dehydrogenase